MLTIKQLRDLQFVHTVISLGCLVAITIMNFLYIGGAKACVVLFLTLTMYANCMELQKYKDMEKQG